MVKVIVSEEEILQNGMVARDENHGLILKLCSNCAHFARCQDTTSVITSWDLKKDWR